MLICLFIQLGENLLISSHFPIRGQQPFSALLSQLLNSMSHFRKHQCYVLKGREVHFISQYQINLNLEQSQKSTDFLKFTFSILLLNKEEKLLKAEVINSSLALQPLSQSLTANRFQEPNEKLFLCQQIYFKNKKQNKAKQKISWFCCYQ